MLEEFNDHMYLWTKLCFIGHISFVIKHYIKHYPEYLVLVGEILVFSSSKYSFYIRHYHCDDDTISNSSIYQYLLYYY